MLAANRHGLFAVGDGRDDDEIAPQSEQKLERLAKDRVVLDDDDPDPLVRRHDGGVLLSGTSSGVMRLSALVHLELEVRDAALQLGDECRHVGPSDALEQRDIPARLREQRVEHRAGDLVEALALRDRLAVGEAEVVALADREPVQLRRPATRR